jgi:hypothetical protein
MPPNEAKDDGNSWLLTSPKCPFLGYFNVKGVGIPVIFIRASTYTEVSQYR